MSAPHHAVLHVRTRLEALPALRALPFCLLAAACTSAPATQGPSQATEPPAGWSELAPMPVAKVKHTAVLLDDGRVLVAGGEHDDGGTVTVSRTSEIYDPATDQWTPTTPMGHPRVLHGALLMYDGRVLVWGGYDTFLGGDHYLNHGEIYDPATEQWTPTAAIGLEGGPSPRLFRHNGEHLVVARSGVYEYDAATDTVFPSTFIDNAAPSLVGTSVSVFPDGGYLVAGGDAMAGVYQTRYVDAVDVYDQSSHGKHSFHATLIVDDARVLLLGGVDSRGELFDRTTKEWQLLSEPIASKDEGLFPGKPGKVISFGSDRVAELDLESLTFTELARPEPARWGADGNTNTVQLADGSLWVCGGWLGDASPQGFSDKTFRFDALGQ
jgi:hypothetical protein